MASDPEQSKTSARKWSRMPAHLRLALEQAAAEHLAVHGSRFYDVVRDDPRFAPWTGTHLGHRGEKYFDRVVAVIKLAQARHTRLRQLRCEKAEHGAGAPSEGSSAAHNSASRLGNAGSISFAELMDDQCRQRDVLKLQAETLVGADGFVKDLKAWSFVSKQLRDVNDAILRLSKQYQGNLGAADARGAIFGRIGDEFRHEPERGRRLLNDLNEMLLRSAGMPGTQRSAS